MIKNQDHLKSPYSVEVKNAFEKRLNALNDYETKGEKA
jgi:hypothetical protein